jgi:hypothetical protein
MTRLGVVMVLSVLATTASPLAGQNTRVVEEQVKAMNTEWRDAMAAHDIERTMAVFDAEASGLFILGGSAVTLDSVRTILALLWEVREAEWTEDRVIVTALNDSTAFLQTAGHGSFTMVGSSGGAVPAEYGSTALVKKRRSGWKVVAYQNGTSIGRRVTQ